MSRSWPVLRLPALALAWLLVSSIHSPDARSQEPDNRDDLGTFPTETVDGKGPPAGATTEQRKQWLSTRIARAVRTHPVLSNSRLGVAILDLNDDSWVYRRNGSQSFNVASNTKIVTAVAALALLGPDFRFRTTLAATSVAPDGSIPGDLFIRSLADPTLTTWDLHELAEELSISGVKRIGGGIVVDDTYFDKNNLPPHFDEQPKEQAGFRAPVGATSLNFNTVSIVVTPNPAGSGPAKVVADPKNDYAQIEGLIQTVASGRTRIRVESKAKRGRLGVKVSGQIRREVRLRRFRLRVPDPTAYIGAALRRMMAQHGITVGRRRTKRGKLPRGAKVLASRESPALAEVIRALGKYSNNYVAEMLLKTIGAESISSKRPATWADATKAVEVFLRVQAGLEKGKYRYENGSGLFDSNAFTPEQIVKVLATAYRDFRVAPDFVSSLSIAGADGTLRRRMTDTPAERVVRAKTGTLDHVAALSGYIAVDSRAPLAFAIFVNDVPKWRIRDARSLIDQIAVNALLYARGRPR